MANIFERLGLKKSQPNIYISLGADAPVQVLNYTAEKLYSTQDNLRAVVDFLANSIAQLPLKVYRRDGEDRRSRDRDSVAAKLLRLPNPDQTEYEFIRAAALEYFVFGAVYIWVFRDAESASGFQMRLIPTKWVQSTKASNSYGAEALVVSAPGTGETVEIPRTDFIPIKTYSPGNPGGYVSPMSALRQTLQEQIEAGNFRKQLWHSSGRLNAQITRPKDVTPWTAETRERFLTAFREAWSGEGSKAGAIPLMEDGMKIEPFQTSFKEAQWMESVSLSREACAAAYGVNPALIWHSTTATYASAKDNARALYAESLGPILQMFQQRFNSFLLPMLGVDDRRYVEFDLSEKLKGSFEERANILQSAVGGPYMTRNEARADNNLPPIEGGDELIVPLNVTEGAGSLVDEPAEAPEPIKMVSKSKASELRIKGKADDDEAKKVEQIIKTFINRQSKSVLAKIGAGDPDWWDEDRWNDELLEDLEPTTYGVADHHGIDTAKKLDTAYSTEWTRAYLKAMLKGRSKAINAVTRSKINDAIASGDENVTPAAVFDKRADVDSAVLGLSLATTVASWATVESVRQAKQHGYQAEVLKEWVTGDNARESHQAMNGEQVDIDEEFSNGARWPGDDSLSPDESCGCNCSTAVIIRR